MNKHVDRLLTGLFAIAMISLLLSSIIALGYGVYKSPIIFAPVLFLLLAYYLGYDINNSNKEENKIQHDATEFMNQFNNKVKEELCVLNKEESKDGS